MKDNYIYRGNLATALFFAIEKRTLEEKAMGFTTDSALLGGWKENLKEIKTLKIR